MQGNDYDVEEGNFKKGAFKPIAIGIGVLAVVGGAVFAVLAAKGESEKLGVKEIASERKHIYVMSKAEAVPKWRSWAARNDVPALQQEAFAELAWAKDPTGLELIIKGLASDDHRVRGTAAQAILEYGSPTADAAKPALLKALQEADSSDKPQISWALATLHEASAFEAVLSEYRLGHLSKVQRLDGVPAFDPELLAGMVPLEKLATYATDESESVRQLIATVLSRNGDAKWTAVLIKLVQDKSVEVAREAAVGLGRIGNEDAVGPLLDALSRADKNSRLKFLEALRDGVGAKGLILAIRSVSHDNPEREKAQTRQLFEMMRELSDPRAGDMLVQYIASNPKPHWKTEAALRLAEIGDARAATTLGWRLKQDPLKLYNKVDDPELVRDDNERVVSARMLADLAVLHPDKRNDILSVAEDGAVFWTTDLPQPHANGMRFLAAAGSARGLTLLRKWGDPREPLPKEGQQDFPPTWATAQSALRYLGMTKDPASWGILDKQLNRKPAKVDATMDSLMQGGLAVLGMTLRGLGVGASDGFAEWGDPKAYSILTKYIENPENNEQSRVESCFALSWVATDDQLGEVVKKVHEFNKPDPKNALIRACYLETLVHRPVQSATRGLVNLLDPNVPLEVRHQAARAIGFGGVTPDVAKQLEVKLTDPNTRSDAVLALLIGGEVDQATRAVASYNDVAAEALEEIKDIYNRSFGYWSDKNYEKGDVARWIRNAQACAHVKVNGALQDWPKLILSRALQGIETDNGPHSVTRVNLRVRLVRDAKSADAQKREDAIAILKFMKEKGVLLALRSEPAPLGELARQAFFEVMNPKATDERIPAAAAKNGEKDKPQ
ncbi:HEAT repeat domain-containing protein [Pendulispora rubella]|uniref:HEAT repeat domain-containing protein n=1 Tax=Pendulispora rubella TaxID=2741070 RepID=A0ABZ2L0A6_9BACT